VATCCSGGVLAVDRVATMNRWFDTSWARDQGNPKTHDEAKHFWRLAATSRSSLVTRHCSNAMPLTLGLSGSLI